MLIYIFIFVDTCEMYEDGLDKIVSNILTMKPTDVYLATLSKIFIVRVALVHKLYVVPRWEH